MIYKDFQGLSLSRLGMGNMRLPVRLGKIDQKKAQEIIDYAMAQGINYYDTAYVYHSGKSEPFLGNALKKNVKLFRWGINRFGDVSDAVPVEKRENVFLTTASMRLRQNSRNVTDWLSEALFIMHQQTAHWFPSLTVCSSARPLIKP